ncbi:MAG: aldehyde ferredoxin oxidoreductase family protein [Candidatus Hodarchaeales archaeon]|jgi:aldehyde:ferredoxin oxidoreductase
MSPIFGNFGKLLDVDLTSGQLTDYSIPESYLQDFIGGKGLAARILWDLLPSDGKTDPLGSKNVLIFMVGPLVGLNVFGSSRNVVMTKSPLSKYVAESYGGGFFPTALKRTGYDGLIFRGKSSSPVYLEMVDDNISLNDATSYWGKGIFDVHDSLVAKHGKAVRTALIGPAGENKVRYAAIINDKNRAAARGGVGAVMGSKNLKGIVAKGNHTPLVANEEIFKKERKNYRDFFMDEIHIDESFGKYGTAGGLSWLNNNGTLPTRNWKYGQYEGHKTLSGKYMEESGLLIGRDSCTACATACKRKIKGEFMGHELTPDGSSIEYENVAAFGTMLLNSEVKLTGLATQLCNDFGLDTISTGASIAYVMEATEKELNAPLEVALEWGNHDQIIDAIKKIAMREGYGDNIAEGVMRMAEKINGDEFAVHVKGLELGYHDPRGLVGKGLGYAVSPRGGSHLEGFYDTTIEAENANPDFGAIKSLSRFEAKGKPPIVANYHNETSFNNCLIICFFVTSTRRLLPILEAVLGTTIDIPKMLEIGARAYNMERMIAVREGCSSVDDDLPYRLKHESLKFEDRENVIGPKILKTMIQEYYQVRNWDSTGKPTDKLITDLNLPKWD